MRIPDVIYSYDVHVLPPIPGSSPLVIWRCTTNERTNERNRRRPCEERKRTTRKRSSPQSRCVECVTIRSTFFSSNRRVEEVPKRARMCRVFSGFSPPKNFSPTLDSNCVPPALNASLTPLKLWSRPAWVKDTDTPTFCFGKTAPRSYFFSGARWCRDRNPKQQVLGECLSP